MRTLIPLLLLPLSVATFTGQTVTSCNLVAKKEIQEAVGSTPADGKPDPKNPGVCSFMFDPPNNIVISLEQVTPESTPDKSIAQLKKAGYVVETAPALGDTAFFFYHGNPYSMLAKIMTLEVYMGSKKLGISVIVGKPSEQQKEIAKKVAQKAMARLRT